MRSLFFSCFLLAVLVAGRPVFAQENAVNSRLWHVKVSPQHFFVNALNLELERRLAPESRHGFTFSTRFYSGKTETIDKLCGREIPDEIGSSVKGFGYELMHRIYTKPGLKPAFTQYFAYGFNYHRFDLDYASLGWGNVTEPNGPETIQYLWHSRSEEIKRMGLVATFGLQQPFLFKRCITDIYGGFGYHFTSYSNPESLRYQVNILDFGHRGLYLTLGFKLGYSF